MSGLSVVPADAEVLETEGPVFDVPEPDVPDVLGMSSSRA